jgi:hypothetical protein
MSTEKTSNYINKFVCQKCNFTCCKKGDYTRHLTTRKHKNQQISTNFTSITSNHYVCDCGKNYKERTGLWKHKKKCNGKPNEIVDDHSIEDTTIEYLLKENAETKRLMVDICKKLEPVTNIVTNHNKIFNINVFLNEQCKDAMNMTEFIESIQLTIDDMVKISEQGQTKGMSNILIDKLSSLDVFKRPVHCSDLKREIIYVKDENKWEKEERDKPKIKDAIDQITKKSFQILPDIDQEPDCYLKTVNELLKDPREDKKIISNVAKKIIVKN